MTIFSEIGQATLKVASKLSQSEKISRLLKYTQINPLDKNLPDWDVVDSNLLHKNIRIIPKVNLDEIKEGIIVVHFDSGALSSNEKYLNSFLIVDIFTDLETWLINEENLRPYLIMDEIISLLNNKYLTSIGMTKFEEFSYDAVDDNIGKHTLIFSIVGQNGT